MPKSKKYSNKNKSEFSFGEYTTAVVNIYESKVYVHLNCGKKSVTLKTKDFKNLIKISGDILTKIKKYQKRSAKSRSKKQKQVHSYIEQDSVNESSDDEEAGNDSDSD